MGILKRSLAISLRGNLFNRQIFLSLWNMKVLSILCSLLAVIALTDLVPGAKGNVMEACSTLCGDDSSPMLSGRSHYVKPGAVAWVPPNYVSPTNSPLPPVMNPSPKVYYPPPTSYYSPPPTTWTPVNPSPSYTPTYTPSYTPSNTPSYSNPPPTSYDNPPSGLTVSWFGGPPKAIGGGPLNRNIRTAFPPPDGETWPGFDRELDNRNKDIPDDNTEFWGNGWNPSIQDKNTRQHFEFAKTHDCTMRIGPKRYCAPRPSAISSIEVGQLLDKGIISIPGHYQRRPLPVPWWGVKDGPPPTDSSRPSRSSGLGNSIGNAVKGLFKKKN